MSKLRQLLFSLPHRLVNSNRFGVRWGFFSATVIAMLLAGSSTLHAYVLEGKSWPAGTTVVFQDQLGSPSKSLQDGSATWSAAVAPVFSMWNGNVKAVALNHDTSSSAAVSSGDGVNSMVFSSTIFGEGFGTGTLAVTYYRSEGNSMVEADILFNSAQNFDSYRGALQFGSNGYAIPDIRRVLLHELGHALGLGHPDTAGQHVDAVMNSVISDRETLSSDDVTGAQSMYGAPAAATPTPAPSTSYLANISTRVQVGVKDNVLIGGFIITGSQSKRVILRAIGPSLSANGVTGALANPVLELRNSSGALITSNDNWGDSAQAAAISASGVAPTNPLESAIYATLAPGSYTALVSGANNTSGVALVEAYDIDGGATSKLANISTRGHVGTTDSALIGGFIVAGSGTTKVYVRARGPSLGTGAGAIAGVLVDPTLELHNASGDLLASNDNWGASAQAAQISATGIPPADPHEAAVISTLAPGSYTAIVRGVSNTTGIGLVEIYDLN